MHEDSVTKVFMVFLTAVLVLSATAIGLAMVDGYKGYKAQPAIVTCVQKQMDWRRFSFTDSVVCVPYSTRRDTLTVDK